MANRPSGQDPSMEDILASIRRIIVDDDDKAAARGDTPAAAAANDSDDDDVLELTEVVSDEPAGEAVGSDANASDSDDDDSDDGDVLVLETKLDDEAEDALAIPSDVDETQENEETADGGADTTMAQSPDKSDDRLMSQSAATSAASALSNLVQASDPDPMRDVPKGRPVEDLAMELLKPMLREWLDEHLPAIVERIVEREVRYLSRRPADD